MNQHSDVFHLFFTTDFRREAGDTKPSTKFNNKLLTDGDQDILPQPIPF